MAPEEGIQARQINGTQQTASRIRRVLRFGGAAIGELEVFQDHSHRYQLPPVEEMCQVCQASKWKDVAANCCCRGGQVVLALLLVSPQEFKPFLENYFF